MAALAAALGLLTACDGGTAAPRRSPGAERASVTWEFAHVAPFRGRYADLAVLAEDDIWAVGVEHNSTSGGQLWHYDGKKWSRQKLPEALGASENPPALEEVGDGVVWLRPNAYAPAYGLVQEPPTGPNHWARWDGTRWSSVPAPPPGAIADFEAAGPDDIWVLDGTRVARHWDGGRWTSTRLPLDTTDLAVAGPGDAWAVGSRGSGPGTEAHGDGTYSQPASAHWDGTAWKPVETPQARFAEPLPPEAGASLDGVVALGGGEIRAHGVNTFNHGEVENEPGDQYLRLRWTGTAWSAVPPAPGGCALRVPVGRDDEGGLLLDGNWYLTRGGRCLKITRDRLPLSSGARRTSHQSLWLLEVHRAPGTDTWYGAGHVQVNQSGDPFGAPVVVRLKRRGLPG
ncbi:hypothetical protein ACFW9D_21720 [Streptomyces sp. NPDC059524]|uniref:hypothetical protein n=1 Tax=Streptomyces sp. NPDC059524 TaxID=3346856 RepID=UPI00369CBCD9